MVDVENTNMIFTWIDYSVVPLYKYGVDHYVCVPTLMISSKAM